MTCRCQILSFVLLWLVLALLMLLPTGLISFPIKGIIVKKVIILLFIGISIAYVECPKDWIESEYIYNVLTVAGDEAGLPIGLSHCVAYRESRFKPNALSRIVKNYRSCGLMQLYRMYIVSIANDFHDGGYKTFNWRDPVDNAQVGCRYLAYLIKKFDGSVYLGVLSYTWGETNVRNMKKWSDVPPHCKAYADQVMRLLDEYDESWR